MGIAGILLVLLGILLIVPFGIALRYVYRALRQLPVGEQGPGQVKQQRGIAGLIGSFLVIVATAAVWWTVLVWCHLV